MATERILNEKKAAVSALAEKLKASNAVVLVDYRGIDVADDTALRKELREAGVEYKVIKNTIMKYACEEAGMHDLIEEIKGTISVAISEDEIAPCKILHKYADQPSFPAAKAWSLWWQAPSTASLLLWLVVLTKSERSERLHNI